MGKVERCKLLLDDFFEVIDVMEEAEEFQVIIDSKFLKQNWNLRAVANQVMTHR